MQEPQRILPAQVEKFTKECPDFLPVQGIVGPVFRLVYVAGSGDDIEVAGQHHGRFLVK